jgi:hypothetical protein
MADKKKDPIAFIYHDGTIDTGSAHWRIIDKVWSGDIAPLLYSSLDGNTAWGWIWDTNTKSATGKSEVVVEFYTEIAPHHQSQLAFPAAIDQIQKQLGVEVIDIETPEAPPGILQRFTPTDIPQSVTDPVDYGRTPTQYTPYTYTPIPTKPIAPGPVTLKTTFLGEATVGTYDMRSEDDGGSPYETIVTGGGLDGSIFPSKSSDTALHTHENIVKLVKDFNAGQFDNPQDHSDHKFFSKVAASETHDCFGLFNNKLYFGDRHHADIIDRILSQEGYDWDDFFTKPSLFGWYYKPTKTYSLATDSDAPQTKELEPTLQKLLTATYGRGVHPKDDEGEDFDIEGWNRGYGEAPPDIGLDDLPQHPEQLRLFAKIDPESMHNMDAPGLSVIKVTPPEGATHSNKEKPFIYYAPTHTVFETTDYCHHGHVYDQINQAIQNHKGYVDFSPEAWINGDITDLESSGHNWIKFIHGGPIPNSLIQYFKGQYPDRDLFYNTDDGWIPLDEDSIDKNASNNSKIQNMMHGAFGYINGHLIVGLTHHQAIIAQLLNNGWTWEQLMTVPQAWGWFYRGNGITDLRFTSDAGFQNDEAIEQAKKEFEDLFGEPTRLYAGYQTRGVPDDKSYGQGLKGIENINRYLPGGLAEEGTKEYIYSPIPPPPDADPQILQTQAPTGFPPPRQSSTIVDTERSINPEYGFDGCFGYLEDTDTLYLGESHHAAIIAKLIEEGMSWETLMSSRQMWGWCNSESWDNPTISISFSTDEARQDKGIKPKVYAAFKQAFPDWKIRMDTGYGYRSQEEYGMRARQQYLYEKPEGWSDEEWNFFNEYGRRPNPEELARYSDPNGSI